LISDELQTATVKLYPFYRLCTNAYYRFGFSGSFFKNDPVRVFKTAGFFGPVLSRADDEDLVREGRAVPPVFKFYEYPITTSIRDREYGEFYSSELVLNEGYNNFFAKLLSVYYEEGKSILVMVKRVEHCARIQTALAKLFVESEIYNGKVSPKRREMLKAQFKSGKLPVLVATDQTFGIGQNVPRIEVFANLGGGLSDDKTMQKYGRGLRSFDDKTSIIIIDPYLSGNKWFEKHSKSRLQIAREEYKTGQVYLISTNGLEMKF
jgi:superfamily II DNA or RNA helicase